MNFFATFFMNADRLRSSLPPLQHLLPPTAARMKLYDLATSFTFGRHRGQTVAQVLTENPGYFNYCLQMLDHFALRRADVEGWQQQYPQLQREMTTAAWSKLDEKEQLLQAEQARWQAATQAEEYYVRAEDPEWEAANGPTGCPPDEW
jgi:hypothetical protein